MDAGSWISPCFQSASLDRIRASFVSVLASTIACKAAIRKIENRDTRRRLLPPENEVSMDGRTKGNTWIERF